MFILMYRFAAFLSAFSLLAAPAHAACVNRFTVRTEQPRQVVTLLTGKLTFQEAQALASAIQKKSVKPVEWVSADGKTVAPQFGDLKVVRPMPVACDGKSSGVVMVATFANTRVPTGKLHLKLNDGTIVAFDEQP
jgi:hypothetical protein